MKFNVSDPEEYKNPHLVDGEVGGEVDNEDDEDEDLEEFEDDEDEEEEEEEGVDGNVGEDSDK